MMFLNHSCEPDIGVQGQIVFVALQDLTRRRVVSRYATVDHDCEPMTCRCRETASCRGTITGDDWRLLELQRKYGDHFAWHILRRMRDERSELRSWLPIRPAQNQDQQRDAERTTRST
ncbi:MAG: hypothetical protein U0744_04680 [Gemmataceae bacterium]